jgi:hypothetical protein
VPLSGASFKATVTGTFAATSIGDGFDMSDSKTVDADASTYKPVVCLQYLSTTEGIFATGKNIYANVA